MSESRTSDFATACAAIRLPTAAGHAARASSSVEMASEIFNRARDLPARSMGTNSILAPILNRDREEALEKFSQTLPKVAVQKESPGLPRPEGMPGSPFH